MTTPDTLTARPYLGAERIRRLEIRARAEEEATRHGETGHDDWLRYAHRYLTQAETAEVYALWEEDHGIPNFRLAMLLWYKAA